MLLQVFPVSNGGAPISEVLFTRTGLLGFIGPAGLIFVAGKMDGLMAVGGRRHNADDIVATALAVEPMKFVYRGRYGNAGPGGVEAASCAERAPSCVLQHSRVFHHGAP